jgi:signal transduction histidine kinase
LEEHGGAIVLEDRDDGWTEFTIIIPTMQEKEKVEQ